MNVQGISTEAIMAAAAAATAEQMELVTEKSAIESSSLSTKVAKQKQHRPRSRLGCIGCKKSKVKCDEKQPACSRCVKRGSECIYPLKVSIQRPLGEELDENKAINYYGVVTKYSDIPLLDETKEYVEKPKQVKSLAFIKDLIDKVNSNSITTKDFDQVVKKQE